MKPLIQWLAKGYGLAIAARNRSFDRGWRVTDVGLPVVSVGNLTVGGTGKSPTVRMISEILREQGHHPAIVLRGYGARDQHGSDEAIEHRAVLPEVPVVARPNRVAAIAEVKRKHPDVNVVVLDDGFQHRFVSRQCDVVILDRRHDLTQDDLLPVGRLRELPSALSRATDVIVTHADCVDDAFSDFVESWHGKPPLAWTHHHWSQLKRVGPDGESMVSVSELDGMHVATRFGVGRPKGIHDMIEAAGGHVIQDVRARDHAPVTIQDLQVAASSGAEGLLMTGKDWASAASLIDWDMLRMPVLIPKLELSFISGRDALEARLRQVMGSTANA